MARLGAERLWELVNTEPYVHSLGALTGTLAVQMVHAGLKAIYCSGWQVAGDMNSSVNTYPDLSEARKFAEAVKKVYPDQILFYNCSPSFNWKAGIDDRHGGVDGGKAIRRKDT